MGKRTIGVRRTFTPQFKKDAVHLVVEEGKSLTEVATHLGIARSLLQRWREQLTDTPTEAFPGRGRLAPQARRVRELEQNLRAPSAPPAGPETPCDLPSHRPRGVAVSLLVRPS